MAIAGHTTTLKVSGTAVPVTGEATTALGGGKYQVTSTARRIWSPAAAITVKDAGSPVSASLWSFDYLFGIITFSGYTPTGAVTVDGSYLPVAAIAEVFSFSFSAKADLLDTTSYDGGAARLKAAGLLDASGSFSARSLPTADVDPGASGTQSLHGFLLAGAPKLLEANFDGSILRAWVMLEGVEQTAEVAGLVEFTANFQLATQTAGASFGFGT
jgi:hypothetical protein